MNSGPQGMSDLCVQLTGRVIIVILTVIELGRLSRMKGGAVPRLVEPRAFGEQKVIERTMTTLKDSITSMQGGFIATLPRVAENAYAVRSCSELCYSGRDTIDGGPHGGRVCSLGHQGRCGRTGLVGLAAEPRVEVWKERRAWSQMFSRDA